MQTFADFSKKTPNYLHNPKNLRTFARNFRVCGFTRTRKIRKKVIKKLRYIVLVCLLLLSRWAVASTAGNDFWLTFMSINKAEVDNTTLHLYVYVVAPDTMDVIIEQGGSTLEEIHVPVGGGMVRSQELDPQSVYMSGADVGTAKNAGVRVYAKKKTDMFSCYALAEVGTGDGSMRDAALVFPSRILGKEYIVQTYPTGAPEIAVIATEDNTTVMISQPGDNPATELKLNAGQVYLMRNEDRSGAEAESTNLSGTSVCADKPVAVFQGNEASKIASGQAGGYSANHLFEQTLPVAQWGKEFYIGITDHAKWNFYNVVAAYDNTEITINGGTKVTLDAGKTFTAPRSLTNDPPSLVNPDVKLVSNKPVMVNTFLSCGAVNSETVFDTEGEPVTLIWGNPTMAMMPAWEMRVKEMSFFADTISKQSTDGVVRTYIQVVTAYADAGTFTLTAEDGTSTAVDASLFTKVRSDASMAIANIELPATGQYTLQTTGAGFVGFVYGISSEARAYQYTLGFEPIPHSDSLFITNTSDVAMLPSYNLPFMENQGWYQRQRKDWVDGSNRMDTALICDSTTVTWAIESPKDPLFQVDSIRWMVMIVDSLVDSLDTVIIAGEAKHKWEHQFILPEKVKKERTQYLDYHVQALVYRTPLICDSIHLDTLQAMVRVHAQYRDTVWKIVCAGEVFEFFSDTTLTEPSERYNTTFYYTSTPEIDALPAEQKHKYEVGIDTISRTYTSVGGCDSVSTLLLYVCQSVEQTKDTTICESGLKDLRRALGYFFTQSGERNFESSYASDTGKVNSPWEKINGAWVIQDTSSLKTLSCRDSLLDVYVSRGAEYNGCDSTLALQLRVMPTKVIKTETSHCGASYNWLDENGNLIETIYPTTPKPYTKAIKYKSCTGCPAEGCDSVRYELELLFVRGEEATDTIHVCQNAGVYTYTHLGQSWTFDPANKPTRTPIDEAERPFRTADGCDYDFHPVFIVDTLPIHYDTVVYCYEGGSKLHEWVGHNRFWYNIKGSGIKQRSVGPSFTANFPAAGQERIVYELCDTLQATEGGCDDVYYQTVIFMPDYSDMLTEKEFSDEQWFEWADTIYIGKKVKTDTISNPKNLPFRQYDNYIEFTFTKDLKTQAINGYVCDSTVRLVLRMAPIIHDTVEYVYISSSEKTFQWRGKTEVVPEVTSVTPIYYYDSLITARPHNFVSGIDSIFIISVTVFPAYSDTDFVSICQDSMGYQWPGHTGVRHQLYLTNVETGATQVIDSLWNWDSIPIDFVGHYIVVDSLKTVPLPFKHPIVDTLIQDSIMCDSIWTLALTVNEVYNQDYTYLETYTVLKSNDTMTFFSPKTLFIGYDFHDYKEGIKTAEQLRIEAGAEKVDVVEFDSLYAKKALSEFGCDSTSFLQIHVCQLMEIWQTDTIGDNDSTWTFGGNTTPDEYGKREHTQSLIKGQDFNFDDGGNPIDYTSKGRVMRERYYTDTMRTANDCDSIVHMTLRIFPTYRFDESDETCHNIPYSWHGKTGLHMLVGDNETGVVNVYDSLLTHDGKVDSVYVLALTIYPGEIYTMEKSMCYNDTVQWHGIELKYDPDALITTVEHYFQDPSSPCGRNITMNLKFNPSYGYQGDVKYDNWVETIHVCQYDDFHWYDQDGKEHIENLRDTTGKRLTTIPTDRTGWFTIYDSLKTVGCECDSIFTLHYCVDTIYRSYTDTNICTNDVFEWIIDGELKKTYYADAVGDIYDTIHGETAIYGCDSSYYLHIHIDQSYEIPVEVTLCPDEMHFSWNGKSYDSELNDARTWYAPKEYYDTLRTKTLGAGCDSIMFLHLTILPGKDSVWRDTICIGETYQFFSHTLTESGVYVDSLPNEWECVVANILTLDVLPPTQFEVSTEPVCVSKSATDNTYSLHYIYDGEFAPLMYRITYSDEAKEVGFEDIEDIPITIPAGEHKPNMTHTLDVEIPDFGHYTQYPKPGHYNAVISFDNGICDGYDLMTVPFSFTVNYPGWITEQRHGDVIALLNADYNGGYTWTGYQWYENDSLLVGQNQPYLHIPSGLTPGAEYSVRLTIEGDTVSYYTCPIVAIANPIVNDYAPAMGYLSVVPTCIITANPVAHILSRKDGTYRITNIEGILVQEGTFRADVTEVTMPTVAGMYIFQLWSNDTPEEPYRAIKVIVSDKCASCSTSF